MTPADAPIPGRGQYTGASEPMRHRMDSHYQRKAWIPAASLAGFFTLAALLASCQPTKQNSITDPIETPEIPSVAGLRVSFDTARGIATLAWNPNSFARLDEYIVYRNEDSPDAPAFSPMVGHTKDTVFTDTVRATPSEDRQVIYRVRIKDDREQVGPGSDPARLHIVPEGMIRTAMTLLPVGSKNGMTRVQEPVMLVLQYDNPTRMVRTIDWRVNESDSATRSVQAGEKRGSDTLVFTPMQIGKVSVSVTTFDDAGDARTVTGLLDPVLDSPTAHAAAEADSRVAPQDVFFADDSIHFIGTGNSMFGRIVKWEWDFGNHGSFVSVSGGDTTFRPSGIHGYFIMQNVLRVTDDAGQTGLDTLALTFAPIRFLALKENDANFSTKGPFKFHLVGNKYFAYKSSFAPRIYDIPTDRWTDGAGLPVQEEAWIQVVGDAVFAITPWHCYRYDFALNDWITKAAPPQFVVSNYYERPPEPSLASLGAKIFMAGRDQQYSVTWSLWSYDSDRDEWSKIDTIPLYYPIPYPRDLYNGSYAVSQLIAFDQKVYVLREACLGGVECHTTPMAVFDPAKGSWSEAQGEVFSSLGRWSWHIGFFAYTFPGKDLIRILTDERVLKTFDPKTGNWTIRSDLPSALRQISVARIAISGDSLFWIQPDGGLNSMNLVTGEIKKMLGNSPDLGGTIFIGKANHRLYIYSMDRAFIEYADESE